MAPLEPSPEEIAQQQEMHAELIASMRANYLPKADIEQMEKSFAAQKEALVNKSDEHPPQERSTAELAAEARESLRQSGVPKKVIEDMVESMYPSTNPKRP